MKIDRIIDELPRDFETMRGEARAEGLEFLERLAADWKCGAMRFDAPGEELFAAYLGGMLTGIGGLTVDPFVPEALRMRRFYVRPASRRSGVGRRLAQALVAGVPSFVPLITLNAAAGSERFWEALGFRRDTRDGHTHVMERSERSLG